MARLWRVEYAGACYHVINRGNYRRNIFGDEGAALSFERTLGEAAVRFDWKVHAYVIMRNHFHLALELTDANLSIGMQWLQSTWARRYNNYRKVVGRPFQGRYKSIHVEPGRAFARVCDYIHLNPVRAGVVELPDLANYRFCSFYIYTKAVRPGWLCSESVLREAGAVSMDREDWTMYSQHLDRIRGGRESQAGDQIHYSADWCVGSVKFRRALKLRASENSRGFGVCVLPGVQRNQRMKDRQVAWQTQLEALAEKSGICLSRLPKLKSAPEKMLLSAAMKTGSDVSNAWLAETLQTGAPRALPVLLTRWQKKQQNGAALARLLKIET